MLWSWSAHAIPLGVPDSSEYPYVGWIQVGWSEGSGVLIAPDVVLTAAHVAEDYQPASSLFVTAPNVLFADSVVGIASSVVHPLYDASSASFDFGLLFLDQPIVLAAYATLFPSDPASLLGMLVEAVGYGGDWRRRIGTGSIDGVSDTHLFTELLAEPGDSGGGLFAEIDGQKVLVGTMSFVYPGLGTYHGIVADARSFIDQYVPDAKWFGESDVIEDPIAVPEPSALALLAIGLLALSLRQGLMPGRPGRRLAVLLPRA